MTFYFMIDEVVSYAWRWSCKTKFTKRRF